MGDISMTFAGLDSVFRNIRKAGDRIMDSAEDATVEFAERILDRSKELVPVDQGDLIDSGRVQVRHDLQGAAAAVSILYGGPEAPHAQAVHEHPSSHTPPSWRNIRNELGQFRTVHFSPSGTGPKFLKKAVDELGPQMPEELATQIRGSLE